MTRTFPTTPSRESIAFPPAMSPTRSPGRVASSGGSPSNACGRFAAATTNFSMKRVPCSARRHHEARGLACGDVARIRWPQSSSVLSVPPLTPGAEERSTMKFLSDKALDRLRDAADLPNLAGTRYSLIERVARGGMGVVYAAQDEKLGRRGALKVLDTPDRGAEMARRLIREAQVLARLEHPGIVPVHDVGTLEDGRVFYTMKFVEGQRLDKYVPSVESGSDRLRMFLRICDAVAFAHARGVLHRDLKPANVMVGPFGEVLVLDWGLAKILADAGEPSPVGLEQTRLDSAILDPSAMRENADTTTASVIPAVTNSPNTGHGS